MSTIRTALVLGLSAAGCLAVSGAAWQAVASAETSIRQATFDRLTSIREVKRRQIRTFFEDTAAQVHLLANSPGVVRSMSAASRSFATIPRSEDDAQIVEAFYAKQVRPLLTSRPDLVSLAIPSDELALAAQRVYLAENPYPIGDRNRLVDPGDGSAYAAAHAKMHDLMTSVGASLGYHDILLIEPESGRVVYSLYKEIDFGTRLVEGPFSDSGLAESFHAAMQSKDGRVVGVDFSRYVPSYLAPAAFLAAPIRENDRLLGVLAVQIPIDRINQVMTGEQSWEQDGLGLTGETYLVGADKLMRSDSRFIIETPGKLEEQLAQSGVPDRVRLEMLAHKTSISLLEVDTVATSNALDDQAGTEIIADYAGTRVLSSYAPMHVLGFDWAIVAEIQTDEVFAPIQTLRRRVFFVTLIAVGVFVSAALVVLRLLSRTETLYADRDRVDRDLSIARSIQQGLLPKTAPQIDGYSIAGWSKPADQTGGDYFDWQQFGQKQIAISLADVSGHGIGPALVTAVCRAYARASFAKGTQPARFLRRINALLHEDLPPDRFVTFVIAILEAERNELHLLSAGHGPLLIFRKQTGRVEVLAAHGIPLGVEPDAPYEAGDRLTIEIGDIVLLITDGFFEWQNDRGKQFGIERTIQTLCDTHEGDPEKIIASLYAEVRMFAGQTPQQDDLTAIAIKRNH